MAKAATVFLVAVAVRLLLPGIVELVTALNVFRQLAEVIAAL